ncbi:MAG: GNAT family N-acetyltransferase [Fibrobacterota bacterium]
MSLENCAAFHGKAIKTGLVETYVIENNDFTYGHLTIGKCRDKDKTDNVFELWGIYIDPNHLRHGFGQKLLAFCESQAVKRGNHEIVIWVLKKNKIGRNFYDKNGYKPDGTEKHLEHISAVEVRYTKSI